MAQATNGQERMDPRQAPTGDLLRRLVANLNAVVDKQVQLARLEARENVRQVTSGGIVLAVAGALLLGAYIGLIVLLIAVLTTVLLFWAAALVVTVVLLVVGGIVGLIGFRIVRIRPMAETRQTLIEDVEWAKRQVKLDRR